MISPTDHWFAPSIAADVGVTAAVIFQHIRNVHERYCFLNINYVFGRHWVQKSYKELQAELPYLTYDQIRRGMERLNERGYLERMRAYNNQLDSTYCYTLPKKNRKTKGEKAND